MSELSENPRAVLGSNQGPPFDQEQVDKLDSEGVKFLDVAGKWLDKKKLDTEDDASRLGDFITGIKKRRKAIDQARADAKKPHDDAGKAVQAAFLPILGKLDLAVKRVQPLLSDYLAEKERREKAEAKRKADEARAAQEEADRLAAQAAARNDISGEAEAEEARKRAAEQAKEAERAAKQRTNVRSATGGGRTVSYRTYWIATIKNARIAFMEMQEEPEVLEALRKVAERRARAKDFDPTKDTIPGVELTADKRAV